MPLSSYPRTGQPIAPKALRTMLGVPISKKLVRGYAGAKRYLCDLDASTWQSFTPEQCQQLADEVVHAVRVRAKGLRPEIDHRPVPPVPADAQLDELALEQRTYNRIFRLLRQERLTLSQVLQTRTIGELLALEGFGAKCLVDLLTSIEAVGPASPEASAAAADAAGDAAGAIRAAALPLCRYPRVGQPLAPAGLAGILALPIPRTLLGPPGREALRLCDLDARAWQQFSADECRLLGRAIIHVVAAAIANFEAIVWDCPIPAVPSGTTLEDLRLETRAHNFLTRMFAQGIIASPQALGGKTIRILLEEKGFGAKCVVDLLTCFEASALAAAPAPERSATGGAAEERAIGIPERAAAADGPGKSVDGERIEPGAQLESTIALALSTPWVFDDRAFRNTRLPRLPENVTFSDLRLSQRTFNCLVGRGFQQDVRRLETMTVGELLDIRAFGTKCLVDYLTAVDRLWKRQAERERVRSGVVEGPRHEFLEDELRDLFLVHTWLGGAARVKRNYAVLAAHYGLDGSGGVTLREVGERFGLTRERIRQICARWTHALPQAAPPLPRLEAACALIEQHVPCAARVAEGLLAEQGLSRKRFRIEGLIRVGRLLGLPQRFEVRGPGRNRMVVGTGP